MNPTVDVFEKRIAALEGGVAALATRLRPGGRDARHPHAGQGRRRDRLDDLALRRHLQPLPPHPAPPAASTSASPTPPTTTASARPSRPRTQAIYAETVGNPKIDVLDIEKLAGIAHERGRAAHHRQHDALPRPVPAHRARGRHRRPLRHQVHRRPRHLHRRHDRRRGQVRLGGVRPVRRVRRPRPDVPRRRLHRGVRPPRLHPQGPRPGAARHRRLPVAVQRLPAAARHRDAAPAHAAPRRERPRRRQAPRSGHPRVDWVNYPGLETSPYSRPVPEVHAQRPVRPS